MPQPTWNEIAPTPLSERSVGILELVGSRWVRAHRLRRRAGMWQRHGQGSGGGSVSAGPLQSTRRSLASLVDELETTEVEMTHD